MNCMYPVSNASILLTPLPHWHGLDPMKCCSEVDSRSLTSLLERSNDTVDNENIRVTYALASLTAEPEACSLPPYLWESVNRRMHKLIIHASAY